MMDASVIFRPSSIEREYYPGSREEQEEALKNSAQLQAYRAYREEHKNDRWNPEFHFYAPDGRINDPNGLCFWKGMYHLFYQAYPPQENTPVQDRLHWGHAVSEDMVHWRDLPLAIYPDVEYACFSGSSLAEENRVIAIYHGRWCGTMIATASDPLLLNWEKDPADPVIPILPHQDENGGRPYSIFDPFLWKDETGYYALSGCMYGDLEQRGKSLQNEMVEHLFHSNDLRHWTYMGELAPGGFPHIPRGNDGACPYFWPLGDKYVLLNFSHMDGAYLTLGTFDQATHRFRPETSMRLNHGRRATACFQAPCATPDGQGGLYLIFNTKDACREIPRNGAMSMMYHLTLDADGAPHFAPIETLASLHRAEHRFDKMILEPFQEKVLPVTGKKLDIHMKLNLKNARILRLRLLRSPGCEEYTDVNVYMSTGAKIPHNAVTLDSTYASRFPGIRGREPEMAYFDADVDGSIDLRVLVDKCMVEVFMNGQNVILQMVYPTRDDSEGISLTAIGDEAEVEAMEVWEMGSIYETAEGGK